MQSEEIINNLISLNLKQKSLAGIFKVHKQEIWRAIHTDNTPLLRTKIINYITKKLEAKQ